MDGDPWMDAERFDTIVLNDRIISGMMWSFIRTESNVSPLKQVNYYLIVSKHFSLIIESLKETDILYLFLNNDKKWLNANEISGLMKFRI